MSPEFSRKLDREEADLVKIIEEKLRVEDGISPEVAASVARKTVERLATPEWHIPELVDGELPPPEVSEDPREAVFHRNTDESPDVPLE